MTDSFLYPEGLPPTRLDKVLALQLGFGVRRCRALIEAGRVLVDDRPCAKGALIRPGQHIRVTVPEDAAPDCHDVRLVARNRSFAALAKPGGLHTVAGQEAACLESCLPGLGLEGWELLNRLDCLTSGLVLAAAEKQDAAAYKGWQDAGQVGKWYLALARGLVASLECRGRILDDKRSVVRVTTDEDDPLRWTRVRALRQIDGNTLLLVKIFKGRRHQIRAHLAHAGHPLLGDPVYGAGEPGGLYLHHWRLDMPGFTASLLPDWPCIDSVHVERLVSAFDSD
jgi:23S rRNA pseudouridine1911/1915/1917 synthase